MTDISGLQASLKMIVDIRSRSSEILKCASEGMTAKHGDEGKEKKFLSELKLKLDTINNQIKYVVFN